MKLLRKNTGFTLLEVVISVAILAMISIPLLSYFSTSSAHNGNAKVQQGAILSAQEAMEELKTYETDLSDLDNIVDYSTANSGVSDWTKDSVKINESDPDKTDCVTREVTINGVSYTLIMTTNGINRTDKGNQTDKEFFSRWWQYTGLGTSPNVNIDGDGGDLKKYYEITGEEYKEYVNASMNAKRDCIAVQTNKDTAATVQYFRDYILSYVDENGGIAATESEIKDSLTRKFKITIDEDASGDYLVETVNVVYTCNLTGFGVIPDYKYQMEATKVKKSNVAKYGSNIFLMFSRPDIIEMVGGSGYYKGTTAADVLAESTDVIVNESAVNSVMFEGGNQINIFFITETNDIFTANYVKTYGSNPGGTLLSASSWYTNEVSVQTSTNVGIPTASVNNVKLTSNIKECFTGSYTNWADGVGVSDTNSVNRLAGINLYVRLTAYKDEPLKNLYESETYMGNTVK
ncbi:MAG: type II secretion system GspH family protein [Lachnospiraceae bacterium]|nr:type II secretion system GspH family protein [Lachnospiraceae bacterium]